MNIIISYFIKFCWEERGTYRGGSGHFPTSAEQSILQVISL